MDKYFLSNFIEIIVVLQKHNTLLVKLKLNEALT